jgi:hypothetical protein
VRLRRRTAPRFARYARCAASGSADAVLSALIFCTCCIVSPRPSPSFSWLIPIIIWRSRTRLPRVYRQGWGPFFNHCLLIHVWVLVSGVGTHVVRMRSITNLGWRRCCSGAPSTVRHV